MDLLRRKQPIVLLLFSLLVLGACSDISFDMPKGPKGDDGKSAYDI